MTVLHSNNFDSYAQGASVPDWIGHYSAWEIDADGNKVFFPNGIPGGFAKYLGIAPRTDADYSYRIKAIFNGAALSLHGIGHGDGTSELWGGYLYRWLLSGTAAGVTASMQPFISSGFPGELATGSRSIAIAAGDIIGVRFKVVAKVLSVWVWNTTTESMPTSPMASYTDTTQRAAGTLALIDPALSVVGGPTSIEISDAPAGATAVTLGGPSSGLVGVASANFTVGTDSGLTGDVIVTPSDSSGGGSFSPTSVTLSASNATDTFTYTAGSAGAKSISVTNDGGLSNASPITYTATSVTVIPVDDTDLFWSPYSWDTLEIGDFGVPAVAKQTNLSGSYVKFKFTGSTVLKLGIDSSMYTGISAGELPILMWSVDNGTVQTVQLGLTTSEVTLATGLTTGTTYPVQIWVKGLTNSAGTRWGSSGVSPTNVVRINGIRLDGGGSVSAPDTIHAKRAIIYGDSITEGHRSLRNGSIIATGMGRSLGWFIGEGLGTEFTVAGFSGQDYLGGNNISDTWDGYSFGRPRSFAEVPDYVFVVLGSNSNHSAAAVTAWLEEVRAALGVVPHLFCCVATSGIGASAVLTGVSDYKVAHPTDLRTHNIDVRSAILAVGNYHGEDGLHIDEKSQAIWAAAVVGAASQLVALKKPTATKTVTLNLVNASNAAQSGLSALKWAWFDEAQPQLFTQPTDSGSVETTDGSGDLSITVHTDLSAAGVGWLVVTNSDGTTGMVHKAFSGPVAVA